MRRPRKSARTAATTSAARELVRAGRDGGRRVQRRDERLPLHPARLSVLTRGEQLLELVDDQDQARRRGGGIGRRGRSGVRDAAGGRSHRLLDQHRRLTRRRRQRPVHRHRIRACHLGQLHRQLPQRTDRWAGSPAAATAATPAPEHPPPAAASIPPSAATTCPPPTPRPPAVSPSPLAALEAAAPTGRPARRARKKTARPAPGMAPAPDKGTPATPSPPPGASPRRAASTSAAGARPRAAATNTGRTGSARPSAAASNSAVSLRAVRLMPRSRSLTDRGLRPAASASSSWVSLAWARSCRSNPANPSAGCSAMVGVPPQALIPPPGNPARSGTGLHNDNPGPAASPSPATKA